MSDLNIAKERHLKHTIGDKVGDNEEKNIKELFVLTNIG